MGRVILQRSSGRRWVKGSFALEAVGAADFAVRFGRNAFSSGSSRAHRERNERMSSSTIAFDKANALTGYACVRIWVS